MLPTGHAAQREVTGEANIPKQPVAVCRDRLYNRHLLYINSKGCKEQQTTGTGDGF